MEGCKEVIESIVRSEVQLTSRADIVAAFAHATFLKYSFLCKGDRMFEDGWNGGEVYHFYYRHDRAGDVELKGMLIGAVLLLSAYRTCAPSVVATCQVNLDEHCTGSTVVAEALTSAELLHAQIVTDLVREMDVEVGSVSSTGSRREEEERRGDERSTRAAEANPLQDLRVQGQGGAQPRFPFQIGEGDRMPGIGGGMYGGGQGMLIGPGHPSFGRGGIRPDYELGPDGPMRPGSRPPGARYDPFGPPGAGGLGPDPDHLRRPGGGGGAPDWYS